MKIFLLTVLTVLLVSRCKDSQPYKENDSSEELKNNKVSPASSKSSETYRFNNGMILLTTEDYIQLKDSIN